MVFCWPDFSSAADLVKEYPPVKSIQTFREVANSSEDGSLHAEIRI